MLTRNLLKMQKQIRFEFIRKLSLQLRNIQGEKAYGFVSNKC